MIRATFVCALLLAAAGPASAQIEKGDWRVNAGILALSYSHSDVDDDAFGNFDVDSSTVAIVPGGGVRVGYAPAQIFEFGLDLALVYEDLEVDGEDSDAWQVAIGPYAGFNFSLNSADSILVGPLVSLRYTHLDSEFFDSNGIQVVAGGEAKFFVAENASIDVGLFFSFESSYGETDGFFERDVDRKIYSVGPRVAISIWP